jgi:cytoskeleton protein RodZ
MSERGRAWVPAEPLRTEAGVSGAGLGETLAARREQRGLSVEAVARALNLEPAIVRALECEDARALPPPAYTRGYYRLYARLLGLDATAWIGSMAAQAAAGAAPNRGASSLRRGGRERREQRGVLVFSLCLALVLGAAAYWLQHQRQTAVGELAWLSEQRVAGVETGQLMAAREERDADVRVEADEHDLRRVGDLIPAHLLASAEGGWALPEEPSTAATLEPTPESMLAAAPVELALDAGDGSLLVRLIGSSWMDVRDGNGVRLLHGLIDVPGDYRLRGAPPFSVVIGDVSQVELRYADAQLDLGPVRPGRVVRLQVP